MATTDTGKLTVTVTNLADSTNTITTGHNDTSVTYTDGGDAVLVAAASLDYGSTDAVRRRGLHGHRSHRRPRCRCGDRALDVTTGSVSGLPIATGSGVNTIHAQALTDNQVLTLTGATTPPPLSAGDLLATTDTGKLTVTVTNTADSTNTITTGHADTSVSDTDAATPSVLLPWR